MRDGWLKVRLGDVLTRTNETVALAPDEEYVEVTVRLWGRGVVKRGTLTGTEIAAQRRFVARTGRLILSRIDARHGAAGIVPKELDGAIVTSDFPLFKVQESRLLPDYLGWLCKTSRFVDECVRSSEGTTNRVRLQEAKFLATEIGLPPLQEQRRIVTYIDALARRINDAQALRREALKEAVALRESSIMTILRMNKGKHTVTLPPVGNKVRRGVEIPSKVNNVAVRWNVPPGWQRVSVAELLLRGALIDLKDGNHGANHPRSAEFEANGTPFLMASDIGRGYVRWDTANRLSADTITRLRVGFSKANDVLFTHKASIGKTAVADRDSVLSPQVTYYRCDSEYVLPRWLQLFLGSSLFLAQLDEIQEQSTRDFVSITKQYQQFLLLPPIEEQRRMVLEIGALEDGSERLMRVQKDTSEELDVLLPAVLNQAFLGTFQNRASV